MPEHPQRGSRQDAPLRYGVCARTHPTLFMILCSCTGRFATKEEARDARERLEASACPRERRNYDLVAAEMVGGKWRALDEPEEGRLGPEDLAAIAAEEAAYQAAGAR